MFFYLLEVEGLVIMPLMFTVLSALYKGCECGCVHACTCAQSITDQMTRLGPGDIAP